MRTVRNFLPCVFFLTFLTVVFLLSENGTAFADTHNRYTYGDVQRDYENLEIISGFGVQWVRASSSDGEVAFFSCQNTFLRSAGCTRDDEGGGEIFNREEQANHPGFAERQIIRVLASITNAILQGALFLLGVSAVLFDFALMYLVFNMANIIGHGSSVGDAILIAWTAIRDLANILFIGGLVWASIAMILRLETFKPSQLVVKILIAALLVNFSYFFAGVIIDASNFVSHQIYQQAIVGTDREPVSNITAANFSLDGVAGIFMGQTRLSSILDPEILRNADPEWSIVLATIFGVFFVGITLAVFFLGALLLIGRFVILILLLIASPIGILRWTGLPLAGEYGKRWWDALITQATFAPLMILLMAISFKVVGGLMSSPMFGGSGSTLVGLVSGSPNEQNVGLVVGFLIASGFMLASFLIARHMSQQGAEIKAFKDFAKKWVVGPTVGAATTWGVGRLARGAKEWYDKAPGIVREPIARVATLGTMGDRKFAAALGSAQQQKILGAPESYEEARDASEKRKVEVQRAQIKKSKETIVPFDKESAEKAKERIAALSNNKKMSPEEKDELKSLVRFFEPDELRAILSNKKLNNTQKQNIVAVADPKDIRAIRTGAQGDAAATTPSAGGAGGGMQLSDGVALQNALDRVAHATEATEQNTARLILLEMIDAKREMLENKSVMQSLRARQFNEMRDLVASSPRGAEYVSTMEHARYGDMRTAINDKNDAAIRDFVKEFGAAEKYPRDIAGNELVVRIRSEVEATPAGVVGGGAGSARRRAARGGKGASDPNPGEGGA